MPEREELILEVRTELDKAKANVADLEQQLTDLESGFVSIEDKAKAAGDTIVAEAERIDTELRETKEATDALARAMGPELAAQADFTTIISSLERMGLSARDVAANADTLGASLRRAGDIQLRGVADGLDYTNRRMGDLGRSSDQTRSVLANLAGNSAQDLGELGGVVGSLGVGVGQLAEYAVDGNIALGNLAKLAVPLGAVVGITAAISDNLSDAAAIDAFKTDSVEKFTEALREGATELEALRQQAEATGGIEVLLGGEFIVDLTDNLQRAGIALATWNELVLGGRDAIDELQAAWEEQGDLTDDQRLILNGLISAQDAYAGATAEAARQVAFNALSLEEMNEALRDSTEVPQEWRRQWDILVRDLRDGELNFAGARQRVLNLAEAMGLLPTAVLDLARAEAERDVDEQIAANEALAQSTRELFEAEKERVAGIKEEQQANQLDAIQDVTDALEEQIAAAKEATQTGVAEAVNEAAQAERDYADAIREANDALAITAAEMDTAAQRGEAFSTALEGMNRELDNTNATIQFNDRLTALHEAFHDLDDALTDSELADLDLVPDSWEEVRNMPDELKPVVEALTGFRDVMQGEFAQSFEEGGATEAREWAENTRQSIIDELELAGVESAEQVAEILRSLGLLPEQVETTITIAKAEQAKQILDDIGVALDQLPPEVQTQIALLAPVDPLAALELARQSLVDAGISVPVSLDVQIQQLTEDLTSKINGASFGVPTIDIEPNRQPFDDAVNEIAQSDYNATVTVDADTSGAEADIDAIVTSSPVVSAYLSLVNGSAFDEVVANHTADETISVNLRTGTIVLPSAGQLAASIGTVRVPVRAYWDGRIEGSRPR